MGFLWWGNKHRPSGSSRRFDKGSQRRDPIIEPMEERTFWQEHAGRVAFSLALGTVGAAGVVFLTFASRATYYTLGVGFPLFMIVLLGMAIGGFALPFWWHHQYELIRLFKPRKQRRKISKPTLSAESGAEQVSIVEEQVSQNS